MQRFTPLISAVIFIGAVAGIVLPAFFPDIYMHYFMMVLSSIFLVLSAYTFIMTIIFASTPITVVKTMIRIRMSTDLKKAEFRRTQILRANRPDVSAYYTASHPSTKGAKIRDISTTIYCPGAQDLANNLELFGDEQQGYEIIQSFGRALRYRWFMPLIPSYFLRREDFTTYMPFIRNNLTRRTQDYVYINEFDCENPRLDFRAVEYPQHNFEVEISFDGSVPGTLKVRRLKPIGVIDVSYYTSGVTSNVITFKISYLKKEKVRAYWHNPGQLMLPDPAQSGSTPPSLDQRQFSAIPPAGPPS